jgi:hypothetical protein
MSLDISNVGRVRAIGRWQQKSQPFMEIVTIRVFSADVGQETVTQNFEVFCR